MTRDEAIDKVFHVHRLSPVFNVLNNAELRDGCAPIVDSFVALGLLVLETPKTIDDRVNDALGGCFNNGEIKTMKAQLSLSGLQIVEAEPGDPLAMERG